MIGQIAALAFSIDAPLQILLHNADEEYSFLASNAARKVSWLMVTSWQGFWLVSSSLFPLGFQEIDGLKMDDQSELCCDANAVSLGFLCLYYAQSCLEEVQGCRIQDDQEPKTWFYHRGLVLPVYGFCLYFGMVPKVDFKVGPSCLAILLLTNILTPLVLIALGIILPWIARRKEKKPKNCWKDNFFYKKYNKIFCKD